MHSKKIKALSVVASSPVRIAIVASLNGSRLRFSELRESVKRIIDGDLADGSLVWHLDSVTERLEKLRIAGIVDVSEADNAYTLKPLGREIHDILNAA